MNRYKEREPAETINTVRAILLGVGVTPIEHWFSTRESLCSVRLHVPGLDSLLTSGGKGRTVPLSLASAYGEFIERLQNYFLFPLHAYYEFDEELRSCGGFLYDPQERAIKWNELEQTIPRSHLKAFCLLDEKAALRDASQGTFFTIDGAVVALPFNDISSGAMVYVPAPLVYHVYGSNGMCAGNTADEAIVQGTSEVLERYANRRIIQERITPPRVSRTEIASFFPEVVDLIHDLESTYGYDIEVRDCSLGMELPVMAAVLLRRETGCYFVKFGAHPDLSVALERALLELFQFRAPDRFPDFMTFDASFAESTSRSRTNLGMIFHNGAGVYPFEFFRTAESYAADVRHRSRRFDSNIECLVSLKRIFAAMQWPWLIRDVSFLGFPSYQVIVPGISEINELQERELLQYNRQQVARQVVRDPGRSSRGAIRTLAAAIEEELALGNSGGTIASMSRLPLRDNSPGAMIDYRSFLIMVYHALGEPAKAYVHSSAGVQSCREHDGRSQLATYYLCLKAYRDLERGGLSSEEVWRMLGSLFPKPVVEMLHRDVTEPAALLRRIEPLPCPNCAVCASSGMCSYRDLRSVIWRLKLRHSANPMNQQCLAHLLPTGRPAETASGL